MRDLAYWMVGGFLRGILSLVCRIEVSGTHAVPAGPWILASNHLSHFDPPLLAIAFARPIDFLAMRELFQPAWFGFLMEKCHVIPISRERVDTKAFKIALDRLKAGRIVGIFPEGGLRAGKTSVLEGAALTEGISLLAARSGCAVRPVVLVGSDQLYVARNWSRRPRVVVAVGKPIPSPMRGESRKDWAAKLARSMQALYVEVKKSYQLEVIVLPKTPQERWRDGR
jgi:1-acyl-sn-glycerol-3-phosphate acyltransferase